MSPITITFKGEEQNMKGSSKHEITILAVDDEPVNLKLVQSALAPKGYKIITAKNGEEAVNLARKYKPSLILMDILMPNMDGYAACSSIKTDQSTKNIPVIMLTGLGFELNKKLAETAGADGYITKPFNADEILDLISKTVK